MSIPRRIDPPLALLLLLLAAHFVLTISHYDRPLVTDEFYWTGKARYLLEHGRLPAIDAHAKAAQEGTTWGNSDWRPQGYTLFLAATSLGDVSDSRDLRLRVTILQFSFMAAILVAMYRILTGSGAESRTAWIAAVLLGVAPWAFEFVNDFAVDSLNASVMSLGLLLLWRWTVTPADGGWMLFLASLTSASTLLLRPDMFVFGPAMVGLALLLSRRARLRDVMAAAAAILLVVTVQVTYRTRATGRVGVYGGLQIFNRGAFQWADTWLGTEKEGYDFVYALSEGRVTPLPDRAFADESERVEVTRILDRVAGSHHYTEEDDRAFEHLAERRRQRFPLRVLGLRVWHAAHLWLHVDNPGQILDALAPVPRAGRRPIYGALLLLRLCIYVVATLAAWRAAIRFMERREDALDRLTLLMFGCVVARTALIGLILNWKVHRYVLAAWPAMLWCAVALFRAREADEARS